MDIIDELWIRHQVVKGLGFLRTLARMNNPPITVSFQTSVRRVGLTVPAAALPLLAQDMTQADARDDLWGDLAQVSWGTHRAWPGWLVGCRRGPGPLGGRVRRPVSARHPGIRQAGMSPTSCWTGAGSRNIERRQGLRLPGSHRGPRGRSHLRRCGRAPRVHSPARRRPRLGLLNYPNFNCVDVNWSTSTRHARSLPDETWPRRRVRLRRHRVHWGWVDSNQDGVLDVFE